MELRPLKHCADATAEASASHQIRSLLELHASSLNSSYTPSAFIPAPTTKTSGDQRRRLALSPEENVNRNPERKEEKREKPAR